MREALIAVVLLSAGLAGCIGSDEASVDPANATDAAPAQATPNASIPTFENGTQAPTSLEVLDCVEQGGTFPVPASAYEDELPEGFSLESYGGGLFGVGEPTDETAELILLGVECQSPDGDTVRTGIAYLLVDPPDEWENPEAAFGHGLALAWVTESQQRAAVYEAWGLGPAVSTGEVSLDTAEAPAAQAGSLEIASQGASLEIQTAAEGQGQAFPGDMVRLFAADEEGTVSGAMDANWTRIQIALGGGVASGSGELGAMEEAPAQPGVGFHNWGFDEVDSYVELPPREGS